MSLNICVERPEKNGHDINRLHIVAILQTVLRQGWTVSGFAATALAMLADIRKLTY